MDWATLVGVRTVPTATVYDPDACAPELECRGTRASESRPALRERVPGAVGECATPATDAMCTMLPPVCCATMR